jgi:hypothetical protein
MGRNEVEEGEWKVGRMRGKEGAVEGMKDLGVRKGEVTWEKEHWERVKVGPAEREWWEEEVVRWAGGGRRKVEEVEDELEEGKGWENRGSEGMEKMQEEEEEGKGRSMKSKFSRRLTKVWRWEAGRGDWTRAQEGAKGKVKGSFDSVGWLFVVLVDVWWDWGTVRTDEEGRVESRWGGRGSGAAKVRRGSCFMEEERANAMCVMMERSEVGSRINRLHV